MCCEAIKQTNKNLPYPVLVPPALHSVVVREAVVADATVGVDCAKANGQIPVEITGCHLRVINYHWQSLPRCNEWHWHEEARYNDKHGAGRKEGRKEVRIGRMGDSPPDTCWVLQGWTCPARPLACAATAPSFGSRNSLSKAGHQQEQGEERSRGNAHASHQRQQTHTQQAHTQQQQQQQPGGNNK